MSILSLSTENKDKLLQLIESLKEVFEQKDALTERAEPFYTRMSEITEEKKKLIKKSEEYDPNSFKSKNDVSDLSEIILKSKQLDEEIESINASSRSLNIEFNEIINQENEIKLKIKELVELASKEIIDEIKSLFVEKLGLNVFIIKPNIPDVLCVVDRNTDEIINCRFDIVKSLSEIYSKNSVEIAKKVESDDYKQLEEFFLASKAQKEQSIDERLALVPKVLSVINEENESNKEVVLDVESKSIEFPSKKIEETIIQEQIPTQEEQIDSEEKYEDDSNILSLDSILQDNKFTESNVKDSNIIIIKDRFDNSNSKVANSTKKKLQNIINNFKGTYALPIIKSELISKVETKNLDPIASFINPKAA